MKVSKRTEHPEEGKQATYITPFGHDIREEKDHQVIPHSFILLRFFSLFPSSSSSSSLFFFFFSYKASLSMVFSSFLHFVLGFSRFPPSFLLLLSCFVCAAVLPPWCLRAKKKYKKNNCCLHPIC